ncbi:MAG: energy transducer TonB [Ignavibacteriaceae bacterium]
MKKITLFFVFALLLIPSQSNFPSGKDELYKPFAQVMPEPDGGISAIYSKIKYPETAQKAGVQGKVYLLIYINENGSVDDIKVLKGLGAGCDEAAVDAVKQTKFSPGKDNGVAVKVKLSMPITFKLE